MFVTKFLKKYFGSFNLQELYFSSCVLLVVSFIGSNLKPFNSKPQKNRKTVDSEKKLCVVGNPENIGDDADVDDVVSNNNNEDDDDDDDNDDDDDDANGNMSTR